MIKKLVVLGPPGVGKGTISKLLENKKGIKHISTGDIFRYEIGNGTDLGREIKKIVENGDYVPDDLTNQIVFNFLSKKEITENGFVLDGFPRTPSQAKFLEDKNIETSAIILFDAPKNVIIDRLSGRRTCPICKRNYHINFHKPKSEGICDYDGQKLLQREDDTNEKILKRLEIYKEKTFPLIDFYKEKIIKINADNDIDTVFEEVIEKVF